MNKRTLKRLNNGYYNQSTNDLPNIDHAFQRQKGQNIGIQCTETIFCMWNMCDLTNLLLKVLQNLKMQNRNFGEKPQKMNR